MRYGGQGGGARQGRADVGELRGDVVRGGELGGGEGDSAHQGGHPGLPQPAPAVDQSDEHKGHDEGQ
jgi:hypothetical protein